jgi:hypothetical protein
MARRQFRASKAKRTESSGTAALGALLLLAGCSTGYSVVRVDPAVPLPFRAVYYSLPRGVLGAEATIKRTEIQPGRCAYRSELLGKLRIAEDDIADKPSIRYTIADVKLGDGRTEPDPEQLFAVRVDDERYFNHDQTFEWAEHGYLSTGSSASTSRVEDYVAKGMDTGSQIAGTVLKYWFGGAARETEAEAYCQLVANEILKVRAKRLNLLGGVGGAVLGANKETIGFIVAQLADAEAELMADFVGQKDVTTATIACEDVPPARFAGGNDKAQAPAANASALPAAPPDKYAADRRVGLFRISKYAGFTWLSRSCRTEKAFAAASTPDNVKQGMRAAVGTALAAEFRPVVAAWLADLPDDKTRQTLAVYFAVDNGRQIAEKLGATAVAWGRMPQQLEAWAIAVGGVDVTSDDVFKSAIDKAVDNASLEALRAAIDSAIAAGGKRPRAAGGSRADERADKGKPAKDAAAPAPAIATPDLSLLAAKLKAAMTLDALQRVAISPLTGDLYSLRVEAQVPELAERIAGSRKPPAASEHPDGLFYRFPASARVSLYVDERYPLAAAIKQIPQYGPVVQLPGAGTSAAPKQEVALYPELGALKKLSASTTSFNPDTLGKAGGLLNTAFDAAGQVQQANASRELDALKKETDLLTAKKALLDAKQALDKASSEPTD